jgi:pimeloyl-ACP methyl ester carboxylesterase
MDAFLGQDWAGSLVAAVVLAAGALLIQGGRRPVRSRVIRRGIGAIALLGGLVLGAGSAYHQFRLRDFLHRFPAPGRLIDVGGYRLHLSCRGPTATGPTVIWIPGGYGQGLGLHHLHEGLATTVRSCLFDRSGTGWSDLGPLPKTTPLQADELDRALVGSGELGPFILAGHSTGGYLAMNYAARHRDRLAGIVLMDPPAAEFYAFSPTTICPFYVRSTRRAAWLAQFGVLWRASPRGTDPVTRTLEPVSAAMQGNEARPRYFVASASVMEASCSEPLEQVRAEGALGDLPIHTLAPDSADTSLQVLTIPFEKTASAFAVSNLRELLRTGAPLTLRLSSRALLIRAGPGTTHQFPYEVPEFVLARVRELIAITAGASAAVSMPR